MAARLAEGPTPALGTLFDLAQRGVLRIEETPKRWGRKFTLYRQPSGEALRAHEQGLLDALFRERGGLADSLNLGKVGQQLGSRSKEFSEPLDAEMIAAGLLDEQRRGQRRRLIATTVLALLAGGLALAGGFIWAAALAGLGAGLLLTGIVAAILAASYATLTAEGERLAAGWRSFRDHLKDVAKGRETLLRTDLYTAYLPYAAGFGLAEGWAKRYQKQEGVAVPAWFSALSVDDSWPAFVAVMGASHSSYSSGTGAGAGASGGGASGAG